MPIKFRCSYCRQFLGISRARAGGIVDCPTCGRSIRVPGLDGVVQPVAAPELNVRDAKLLRALDELAHWNAPRPAAVTAAPAMEDEEEIPQPIAEPIPIEVPLPPEPITIKPPPLMEQTPAAVPSATAEGDAEPAMSVAAALDELQQIPAPVRTPAAAVRDWDGPRTLRRSSRTTMAVAAGLILASFFGGYLAAISRQPAAITPLAGDPPAEPVVDSPPAAAISGRITYKTADGSSLPDQRARVIILPRERDGTAKLAAAGFRATDHPTDVRLATAALRAVGGDLAFTDDGGKFSIHLANPGTFQIIVISNYADRGASDETDPELVRLMTPFFEQPAQVLGRTKVHFGQVRYKGTGTEVWDHSF